MTKKILVLKFGSSVLRSPEHVPDAVHEIYRHVRQGWRLIVVVSAFEGATQALLSAAERYGPSPDAHALATLAASGEQVASAHLTLALDQFGIPARIVDPREIKLEAQGQTLDAEPVRTSAAAVKALLDTGTVLIVPGFFAVDAGGRCVLLGRGGSDQTALFMANALEAECVLLKDVFGIYDRDPAVTGPATHRFEHISWADALGIGGKLIQPKALRFAAQKQQSFSISAPGYSIRTLIGDTSAPPVQILQPPRPFRVVLLGLGTVGLGVYRELERRADRFEVVRVAVRHLARHTVAGLPTGLLTTDVRAAVSEPADLVVEVMGGAEPAGSAIAQALRAGRPVVTANKALVATRNPFFEALAERHRTSLRYSAAVGGAVPMIERVRLAALEGGATNPVVGIRAVLNGTCNFVLELLERGTSLSEAIELAQAKGFAEVDPSSDLSGADAAAKLKLLVEAAHGTADVPAVKHSGIDPSTPDRARKTREAGRVLRLVATYWGGAQIDLILQVSLAELEDDWLAGCVGEENRLEIHRYDGSIIRVSGRGAGRWPTTLAVMADIYDVWRDWTGSQQIISERQSA